MTTSGIYSRTVERIQSPVGEKLAEFGLVCEVSRFSAVSSQEPESGSVRRSIDDAGISVRRHHLLARARGGVLARPVEFVFPAYDNGFGKQAPQVWENLLGRTQDEPQFGDRATNLVGMISSLDFMHQKITERSRVKDRSRLIRNSLQDAKQRRVGSERHDAHISRPGMDGHFPTKAKHLEAGA